MKKTIIKAIVFLMTFIISLLVIGKLMNKDQNNMTMEMAAATLPVIVMERDGFSYNHLNGYVNPMDLTVQRDTITVLDENRETAIKVNTYGRNVTGLYMEVRSVDGKRLVEKTEITNFIKNGQYVEGTIALKDLIEKGKEYSLTLALVLDANEEVYYYTRVIWSDKLHEMEKLFFVQDFHERLYNREAAKTITKYLETNGKLEDNKSFHKVNIHSSFKQMTWGDLEVTEIGEPDVRIVDIGEQTASIVFDYIVFNRGENDTSFYQVEEYYRLRYTPERMYLLDYERTTNQIPEMDDMYANNKILFGITDENLPIMESTDGNVVVFEVADKLCSYNVTTNKLAVIFSFYDTTQDDDRNLFRQHNIKILDVDESGSVRFSVYGYMNRGRHEGEVGICVFNYDSAVNTIEELVYIPYQGSFSVLKPQMEELLYLNREQKLYLSLDQIVYCVDLDEKTYEPLIQKEYDSQIKVSDNHKILVWEEGLDYHCRKLLIRDLNTDTEIKLEFTSKEAVKALGFIGEDIIYGVAREEDITTDSSGGVVFPMYKLVICDTKGVQLKNYQPEGIYITNCSVESNQITLKRCKKNENGTFSETLADHIMNNLQTEAGKNSIVTADIDVYERYVQLQVRGTIDQKSIQILTPKEVVFEGGRELSILPQEEKTERYYVYGPYGVYGIFRSPANAMICAFDTDSIVTDERGEKIWYRGNRVVKNQIMAITEPEKTDLTDSLSVCLNTMLRFEGFGKDTSEELLMGKTAPEVLKENMPGIRILNLTGCELETVLYYLNKDIPVLAILKNNEAVLLTGFNEYNVVVYEPSTGRLYKNGMNDTIKWMSENGNKFITYQKQDE